MADTQQASKVNVVGAQSGTTEQPIHVIPVDGLPVQVPSSQNLPARRYKNIPILKKMKRDGTEGEKVQGGEIATLLKDALSGCKGVTLQKVMFKVTSFSTKGEIAICFVSSSEGISTFEDAMLALNSNYYGFNAANANVRFDFEPTMPTGTGSQLVPCDPWHPAPHLFIATRNFKGVVQAFFTIDCDVIVFDDGDF